MIKVSVFYPYGEGKKFDMGYYTNKHIPMVKKMLGASCKGTAVEQGLAAEILDLNLRTVLWVTSTLIRWRRFKLPLVRMPRRLWGMSPTLPTFSPRFRSVK